MGDALPAGPCRARRALAVADENGDQLDAIVNLICDKDKDMRALGLQQVREEAKGEAATKRLAALLPKLEPEAQAGLLDALADRGDRAAQPAVLEMVKSPTEPVRAAALRAVGSLGTADDVPLLVRMLSKPAGPENTAAKASLTRLHGPTVSQAIAVELPRAKSPDGIELIGILAARRAKETIPSILAAARDDDPKVRMTAMATLGKLAEPRHVAAMLTGVLKAKGGPEREAAEKAVMFVCNGIKDPAKRAEPILAVWDKLSDADRTALLPTLGRVGGPAALKVVEAAMADPDPPRREAGFRALAIGPTLPSSPSYWT